MREREGEEPKKTVPVYKMMRMVNGELYPLFIDAATPTHLGVWYDADSPSLDMLKGLKTDMTGERTRERKNKETGKKEKYKESYNYGIYLVNQATGETRSLAEVAREHPELKLKEDATNVNVDAINWASEQNGWRWMRIEETSTLQSRYGENRAYYNIGINGSGSVETYAMRPGWHAGSLPTMRQIGLGQNKDLRDGRFVWVEGRMSADVDYQSHPTQACKHSGQERAAGQVGKHLRCGGDARVQGRNSREQHEQPDIGGRLDNARSW